MIIDFNFPTRTDKDWQITIHKTTKAGRLWLQKIRFENKEDAFEWYEKIQQIYNGRQR